MNPDRHPRGHAPGHAQGHARGLRTGATALLLTGTLLLTATAAFSPARHAPDAEPAVPAVSSPAAVYQGIEELLAAKTAAVQAAVDAVDAGPAGQGDLADDVVPGALLVTTRQAGAVDEILGLVQSTAQAAAAQTSTPAIQSALQGARVSRVADAVSRVEVEPGQELDAIRELAAQAEVVAVEPVRSRAFSAVPNDPYYPLQWAHGLMGSSSAWNVSTGAHRVRVAVIDSGVLGSHPDLAGRVVQQLDASTGTVRNVGTGVDNDRCGEGHGTFVAGIIGAAGNNGAGVAGINWDVSLVDISLVSPDGNGCRLRDDAILAAIDYAVHNPAGPVDVINLSLGAPQDTCPTAFQTAIDQARAAGVVVVAASGNDGTKTPGLPNVPASCNGVLSVGAVRQDGTRASYSTTNAFIDLTGPGGDLVDGQSAGVISTSHSGGVATGDGTSFAAAHVAGVAALVRAVRPALTPDQVESILERTALDKGAAGRDVEYGWGLVQAGAAAARAASSVPVPAPSPDPVMPVGADTLSVSRVSAGTGSTDAVTQAVAVSKRVFPVSRSAAHVVLARRDVFADALAGSALGFGVGPLLFTANTGPLAPATKQELQRVLAPGRTVYLLGGEAALPATLEGELTALGYLPKRLKGDFREQTAVKIAEEVRRRLPELGAHNLSIAILATGWNWPDAVSAGSLAAYFGIPILLTPTDHLSPDTATALQALQPQLLYVIGGTAAISDSTLQAAAAAAGTTAETTPRLWGPDRSGTAVDVAREVEEVLYTVLNRPPAFAVATNLRRSDGFAHVLSASVIAGKYGTVFVPVEGDGGWLLPEVARTYVQGIGVSGLVAGDTDLVTDQVKNDFEQLLRAR